MKRRIGFTYDLKTDYGAGAGLPEDALAEFDREETIAEVEAAIASGGHEVVRIGHARNLLSRINALGVDIVFNICEGMEGRNRESEVPTILDLYKIPFVGSDGLTLGLTLDKAMTKKAFAADGVPTPKYFVADARMKWANRDSMKFPFIVKPRHEGSSKGISEDSIVSDEKALKKQVEAIANLYRQPALVEEFVYGSEFTVLVIGNQNPQALPPVQISITGRLVAGELVYTSRRLEGTDIEYVCPPKISKALEKIIGKVAVQAYKSVDCRDFGRVDLRVDKKGRPYVLEVNPLPSLSREDVFPLVARAAGMTYNQLVTKIIHIALKRYGLAKT
jgi:D-alanine-D-alanine ligase